jgi:hypothetical protein
MSLLVRSFPILLAAMLAGPASAATFVVVNTNTSGAGSLAKAIADANLTTDADTIEFDINSAAPVHTIGGTLPAITQPLTIDGYSQFGSVKNTAVGDTNNAVLRIELDASAVAIAGAALDIASGSVTILGIAIKNIPIKTIGIDIAESATVKGCFIGTGAAGVADTSGGIGIVVRGSANLGGSAVGDRNLISGHNGAGIQLKGDGVSMLNNQLGIDRNGNATLGNGTGLLVSSSTILSSIGGSSSETRNVFAGNAGGGIRVSATAAGVVAIGTNHFRANDGLAIDLGIDGVTLNDEGDLDSGPNGRLNFPVFTFALVNSGELSLEGFLESQPGSYRIRAYSNEEVDPSGFGEGESFLGTFEIEIPEGETRVDFQASFPLGIGQTDPFNVTATTDDLASGATSEFSQAIEAVAGGARRVVSNTNDSGPGSFRAAVLAANASQAPSTIVFEIPGDAPHTIVPSTGFQFVSPVIIDGYSQPGSSQNTLEEGTNAVLGVVFDGVQAPGQTKVFFNVAGEQSVVRGIGIHSTPGTALAFGVDENPAGGAVEGCFIGVDASGTVKLANVGVGVVLSSGAEDVVIGGFFPGQRNIISGSRTGIVDEAQSTRILNNIIGGDATGAATLGNAEDGINLRGSATIVGSDDPASGNRIVGNGGAGIAARRGVGHRFLANSIADNDGLGIDLTTAEDSEPGVNENDADDADAGTNGAQNFPVLVGESVLPGSAKLEGFLDVPSSAVDATWTLRFYDNAACDESGHGEGEVFLGEADVVLSGDSEDFLVDLPIDLGEDHVLTVTATEAATGNTSEFSECFGTIEPPSVCGDASGDGNVSAADGQVALRTAVGSAQCEACRCDVNLSNSITTSDALLILRAGVGQSVLLACPFCS